MRYEGRVSVLINAQSTMAVQVIEDDGLNKTCMLYTIKSTPLPPQTHSHESEYTRRGPFSRPSQSIRGRSVPWDRAVPVTLDTGCRLVSRHTGH